VFAPVLLVAYACLTAISADAQLIANNTQVPRTPGKPPVVFVNGYQNGCAGDTSFAATFGSADQLLQRDGRVSLFFNNCEQARNASIEEIGNALRRYLEALRFSDGQTVPDVDIVAHSMGGLIVRSYLSGKQIERGAFQPPPETKIRKMVLLAVPNFGAVASLITGAPDDVQTRQMRPGSPFLFDLATWNQGMDDLRGVDAVAVVGDAGLGLLPPLEKDFDDTTVTLTSGSLDFALAGRTRVLPYCHTTGIATLGCSPGAPAIARWTDDQHQAARIALSFLNDTAEWRSSGTDITDSRGGLFVQLRDANDRATALSAAFPLQVRDGEIAWTDRINAIPLEVRLTAQSGGTAAVQVQVPRGTTAAFIAKPAGPSVAGVLPSAGAVTPRAVAPGMFASIYGANLAPSVEQAQALPYPTTLANTQVLADSGPLGLHYVSPTQINAVVPDTAAGLIRMTVVSGTGQRTVNVVVEPAVPTLFAGAVTKANGPLITPSAPAARGDYISIYLTGLGATEKRGELDWARVQPQVTVGGQPCAVSYAGRAPGYAGLDQVDCQIAANAATGETAQITVTSGRRTGTGTVALR
jgi:uncharacterized protein (TIGR03437 family)